MAAFVDETEPPILDHEARTKALNEGQPLDPLIQRSAKKCPYCKTELKGPCASQFADLYKCAIKRGDKRITSPKCKSFADIYIDCVELDYAKRQTLCPMYMTFLKQNIDKSPCKKQLRMMRRMCFKMNKTKRPQNERINSICANATNELRNCVQGSKHIYDYMDFWRKYDGTRA
eukprot:158809_1